MYKTALCSVYEGHPISSDDGLVYLPNHVIYKIRISLLIKYGHGCWLVESEFEI